MMEGAGEELLADAQFTEEISADASQKQGADTTTHMAKSQGNGDGDGDVRDEHTTKEDDTMAEVEEESEGEIRLEDLATMRNQDDLEQDINRQAEELLVKQADERDQTRLHKTQMQKERLINELERLKVRYTRSSGNARLQTDQEMERKDAELGELEKDLQQIRARMRQRHTDTATARDDAEKGGGLRTGESRRDFLIRTGKITPFSALAMRPSTNSSNLADVMLDAETHDVDTDELNGAELDEKIRSVQEMSHRNLLAPGFQDSDAATSDAPSISPPRGTKRKRKAIRKTSEENESSEGDFVPKGGDRKLYADDGSSSDMALTIQETEEQETRRKKKAQKKRKRNGAQSKEEIEDLAGVDDGDEQVYQSRLDKWVRERSAARQRATEKATDTQSDGMNGNAVHVKADSDDSPEWFKPHPTRDDTVLDDGLKIPGDIYHSLFDYQKTGVQWLWELYGQEIGGIIGDEMGLGKTIQVIAFLAALHYSGKLAGPIAIVCPATVMKQWVNEFHRWWPPLRVSILHSSGSGMMDVDRERDLEYELEHGRAKSTKGSNSRSAQKIVNRVVKEGHVLVTTYSGLQTYAGLLHPVTWNYAVLDEGHKIRNPNASIAIYAKALRTPHRIILSGTPMQNNLTELWSLFDFCAPMRLGSLVNFRTQFEIPIKIGGYANASNLEVETALRCAEVLKDAISPYLLQRFKVDVAADLPKKSEQVLFCKLTKLQRGLYQSFLESEEMKSITNGKRQALYGIDVLRKICNHPDLTDHKRLSTGIGGYKYGASSKSGKMKVTQALLQLWRDTGHKALVFAQHRIMLDILEGFIKSLGGFNYRRMDGNTQIKDRQAMVDEFNRDDDIHVFLLTTRVGGLGINLIGADRIIIFDPDWNPSTDMQARERAWRLGQKREVEIFRLMTAGTIEEKIYHRQIFKQFLTNKILRDPKQRQTFHLKDLHDLFTLGDANEHETETGGLFKGTSTKFEVDAHDQSDLPAAKATSNEESRQISAIEGVASREEFKSSEKPIDPRVKALNGTLAGERDSLATKETSTPHNPNSAKSDSRLLSTIFSRADVHSAVEHEAIIGGSSMSKRSVEADADMINKEAKRVAAQAAAELNRAREVAKTVPIGVPTWTGSEGIAGRPDHLAVRGAGSSRGRGSGRGGLGSSSMLAGLSARRGEVSPAPSSDHDERQPKGSQFMKMIQQYLTANGGSAYTQMLIDHFNRYCGTPQRTAEFKEMLRQIAKLEKSPGAPRRGGRIPGTGGRGRWVLKKSFGGTADD